MQIKQSKKRSTRYKKKQRGGFAKAVMSVVNKKSETKQHTTVGQRNYNAGVEWNTWNLTNNMIQGLNTSQRIGDKVFIKQLRLSMAVQNSSNLGSSNNSALFRVVVFRGKYDYALTSYPETEVFELNAGANPSPNGIFARIDTNQVTPLYDKVHLLPEASLGGQILSRHFLKLIRINKQFMYKDDDNYGKSSNLYLGISYYSPPDSRHSHIHNVSFTYTDV